MLEQERLQPAHPGEVLAGEFLAPKGRIAGDTALRLAVAFGTTAEFWMGLQMRWALAVAARRGVGAISPV